MTTVLACTDLSDGSDEALRQAHTWAQRRDAELVVVHVVPPVPISQALLSLVGADTATAMREHRDRCEQRVVAQVTRVTGRPPDGYKLVVVEGTPHQELLRVAATHSVTLIVLAGTSKHVVERTLLGSTAEKVLRHSPVAVLIARPSPADGEVAVASDLSDLTVPAVEAAVVEAARLKTDLVAVYCLSVARPFSAAFNPAIIIDDKTYAAVKEAAEETLHAILARFGSSGRCEVVEGDPKRQLVAFAKAEQVQLLVMGTHGESGVTRILLGSVALAAAHRAPCSVLVVRHHH
ncbi:MAG TPA: universal stress protein [Sorangium sp.]|nr:universal stress protein [Sorangium sp.]